MTEIIIDGIPILMPSLRNGTGETPADGGCVMQAAAWLIDGSWTDAPLCVHRVFRRLAISINDSADMDTRQQLWPLIPRLIGTGPTGDRQADARLSVQLAIWSAARVLPLIKNAQHHKVAADRISRARSWLAEPGTRPAAAAAADAAAAAAAYAAAAAAADADAAAAAADAAAGAAVAAGAYAAAYAADDADADAAAAAAYAAAYADAAAYAAAADAYAAAYAAAAYAYADDADAAAAARIRFLVDLLDEYDWITGRTAPAAIPAARWEQLAALLTA